MGPRTKLDAEAHVRSLCEAANYDAATTAALRAYGQEVLRFLYALQQRESDAPEAFSVFSEKLWHSMNGFAWECSLRTWMYLLARRSALDTKRKSQRAGRVLRSSASISEVVQEVRTATLTYLRTETKTRMRALRDSLPEEDQVLLMLRVDRGLAWEELARVVLAADDADADALERESARLRKRFQLVKEKLKSLAKREGLLDDR